MINEIEIKKELEFVLNNKNEPTKLKNKISSFSQELKMNVLTQAFIHYMKNRESFGELLNACNEDDIRKVFSNIICANVNNESVILTIVKECQNNGLNGIFAYSIVKLFKKNNAQAAEKVYQYCPDNCKGIALGYPLANCVTADNSKAIEHIMSMSREDLPIQQVMYSYAMRVLVLNFNNYSAQKLMEICPDEFKNEVLRYTLIWCANNSNPEKAFKVLFECFSDDITENIFVNALEQMAENNFTNSISILMEACPEPIDKDDIIKEALVKGAKKNNPRIPLNIYKYLESKGENFQILFSEAMKICVKESNEEALKMLDYPCSKKFRHTLYPHVIEYFVKSTDFNPEFLKLMYKVCPIEHKVHMLAEALVMCITNQEIINRISTVLEICTEQNEQKDLFFRAIMICIDDQENEALEALYDKFKENFTEYAINHAMIYSIECKFDDNINIIKEISLKEGIQVEVFANALVTFIKDAKPEALATVKAEIPIYSKKSIYIQALKVAAEQDNCKVLIKEILNTYSESRSDQQEIYVEALQNCTFNSELSDVFITLVDSCPKNIDNALVVVAAIVKSIEEKISFNYRMNTPLEIEKAKVEKNSSLQFQHLGNNRTNNSSIKKGTFPKM